MAHPFGAVEVMLAQRPFARMCTDTHRNGPGIGLPQIAVWRAAWCEA
jgi:hypothetical protein